MGEMWKFVNSLGTSAATTKGTHQQRSDVTYLHQAFLYWLSKPVKMFAAEQGRPEIPVQSAQKILVACLAMNDPKAVEFLVNNPGVSCNAGFDRLQSLYLEPLQGTHAQLRRHGQRRRRYVSDKEKLAILYEASKVRNIAERLQADPLYPNIYLDNSSCEATLNLWSKRCQFFTKSTPNWRHKVDPDMAEVALGGKNSAQECLDAMEEFIDSLVQNKSGPCPGHMVYSTLLAALAHSNTEDSASRAMRLLKELEEDESVQKSFHMYTSVLLGFRNAAVTSPGTAANQAVSLYEHMKTVEDPEIAYNPVAASIVMHILAKANQPQEAQSILDELESLSDSTGRFPSRIHYNIVLNAWAHAKLPDVTQQIDEVLSRMEHVGQTRQDCKPSIISYTSAMDAYIRSSNPGMVERVEALLTKLEASTDRTLRPDAVAYERLIKSIALRSSRENDWLAKERLCLKMQHILERWRNRASEEGSLTGPNLETYKSCLHSWSMSHSTLASSNGMNIFQLVEDEYRSGKSSFRPDNEVFESTMRCLVKRPNRNSVDVAEKLGARAQEYGVMSRGLFGLFLRVVSKVDPFRAESILVAAEEKCSADKSSLAPDEFCYQSVIRGFALKKDGASHAQRILRNMTVRFESEGRTDLKPGVISYLAVIEAWGKSDDERALEQVESLFKEVCSISPNVSAFSHATYQEAIARLSPARAPEALEQELEKMQTDYESGKNSLGRPDALHFANVIFAWKESGRANSAERAEAILQRMEALYDHSPSYAHLKPTLSCYTACIAAWAKSRDPDAHNRAVALLKSMKAKSDSNPDAVKPTRACFFDCMRALKRSSDTDKIQKVHELFKAMQISVKSGNTHAKPDEQIASIIIEMCGSQQRLDSTGTENLELADSVLADYLNQTDRPHRKVFLAYLQALKHLKTATERKNFSESASQQWPDYILGEPKVRNLLRSFQSYRATEDKSEGPETVDAV